MSNVPQPIQSGSSRRPSKLPVPQQKKAAAKILQEHPEAKSGDAQTSVRDEQDKKFRQISRSHTTSTSGFKVPSSFGYSRKIPNNTSFVRATVAAVPAGRIQSKDDVNTQTFIKHSTPNSLPHDSSVNSSSSMANSSKPASPRSTKLPRYLPSKNNSRLRKLVPCESKVSQPATTLANSQHQVHEPHNDGCLASVKMRRQTKSSQSSVTSLDVHTNLDASMVRPLRKYQKKDVKYSDVMSRKSQGREQQAVQASKDLTMSPRSDSTTSGINETKSPCLLQTSDSDFDTIIAGPTIHQVESDASTVKGSDSKSVEQIWVNMVMQKPSEQVINCYNSGISNVEPPMELTKTGSSSDLDLSPPGISPQNCIISPQAPNNDLSSNESNSSCCLPLPLHSTSEIIKTDPLIELTHDAHSEQWNLSDNCNQRARNNDSNNSISSTSSSKESVLTTGDCEKKPAETFPKSEALQDKACTGDWEMIAAADSEETEQERRLADPIYEGPPRDTLNVYNFQYDESDGDNDVMTMASMDQLLPSKNPHEPLPVISCTNLPVPESTCGNGNGTNMKAKPEDKNSYEPSHKDPKNTQLPRRIISSSSSSQFSECSTLSVGSDSSLISIKNQSLEPGVEVDTKPSIADISTRPIQSLKSVQKLPGLKETQSSVSLRTSQTFPLEVPSVSLCVAALLSKCETSIDKSSIGTESGNMAAIKENESTEKDEEIESREDVTVNVDQGLTDRSYTTCNSSSSSMLTSVEKQDGDPKEVERCQSKPKLQACPILGSRIAIRNEMGNLHASCMSCKLETTTRSRLTWKPNSRTAPQCKDLLASDNADKGNNRNSSHIQMNCLVIDRTVSMCNVGTNLEGYLRIRNQSSKTICYRVSSCVPGKYQIIPPEGRLEPFENAVVTTVSALPTSFVQYEVNQFKVETVAAPNDIMSPSEQRLFWRETSGCEIQTTMVGRVRALDRAGEIREKVGGGRHTSSGDGYAVSQVRRREKEYVEPSSASICMYTIIIGLAAVIIHHYSAMLNAT